MSRSTWRQRSKQSREVSERLLAEAQFDSAGAHPLAKLGSGLTVISGRAHPLIL